MTEQTLNIRMPMIQIFFLLSVLSGGRSPKGNGYQNDFLMNNI